jgi:hypothetical protein
MGETTGRCRTTLAAALPESYLLAGRIDFFDLQQPQAAGNAFVCGLQAAGEADDALLGAAILAHRVHPRMGRPEGRRRRRATRSCLPDTQPRPGKRCSECSTICSPTTANSGRSSSATWRPGDLATWRPGDLEAAAGKPEEACRWANEALDQLSVTLVRRRHGPDPRRP